MQASDYPIRKGVPLPPAPVEIRLAVWAEVVASMEVGDSFTLLENDDYREPLESLAKAGKTGEVRKENGTFGIWRTK